MPLFGLLSAVGQGSIFNQIICDDLATARSLVPNLDAVQIPDNSGIGVGWHYDGINFIPPVRATSPSTTETQTTGETNA